MWDTFGNTKETESDAILLRDNASKLELSNTTCFTLHNFEGDIDYAISNYRMQAFETLSNSNITSISRISGLVAERKKIPVGFFECDFAICLKVTWL
jgi:hypothetical protein